MAASLGDCRVFSVESDKVWLRTLQDWINQKPPENKIQFHYASIGPTMEWGKPENYSKLRAIQYLQHSHSVWKRSDFKHPDLVLIDGRFRIGCFMATIKNIKKPIRILFDDYADRECYHYVEEFAKPTFLVERMAVFDVSPGLAPSIPGIKQLRAMLVPT